MSLQADGRRSLKADAVHLESVHPQVVIPVTADLTILVDDTIPVKTDIVSSVTFPLRQYLTNYLSRKGTCQALHL